MKKKVFPLTFILFICFIIFNIFYNSLEINNIILFSMNIFINNVFPSLFPMFVISNLLIAIGVPEFLGNLFSKIMTKLFNVKGISSFVFFLSMISGYPSNAKYIKELLDKKLINEIDANKILTFTSFANPLFVINTVGIMFFNNKKIGFMMLISHIISNIIIGLLFRNIYTDIEKKESFSLKKEITKLSYKINNTKIFKKFLESISNSLSTLINIFGIITCFLIFNELINNYIKLNPISNSILTGLLEFTSGLKSISILNVNLNLKIYLSMFFISFGGFSVHAQIMNILDNYKINYLLFLFSRIIHGLISIILLYFLLKY